MKRHRKINEKIDCHTHCGVDYSNLYLRRYPAFQSATTLNEQLFRNDIPYAITFPCPNTMYYSTKEYWQNKSFVPTGQCEFPYYWENRYLISEIEHFRYHNLLMFAAISLRCKIDEQIAYLTDVVQSKFLYGLKLHTLADNSSILDVLKYPKLVDFIVENDLPVMCHTGLDTFSNPLHVLQFAKAVPEIRICAAHMAKFNLNFYKELLDFEVNNLFIDTSPMNSLCSRYNLDAKLGEFFGLDITDAINCAHYLINRFRTHIIWGTDSPWTYVAKMNGTQCDYRIKYSDEVHWLIGLEEALQKEIAIENPNKFLFGTKVQI